MAPDRRVGLRVDVDTLRGTRRGVPVLLSTLERFGVQATFFFSVGPDNMGRHLYRLIRPTFLWKMLRTQAASLYGWDILLRGTLWPGPRIGERCAEEIRQAARAGHEIGLHAWDHHAWQAHGHGADSSEIRRTLQQGFDELTRITGAEPTTSAAPGWRCSDRVLAIKEEFPFRYNSDCRGRDIFRPRLGDRSAHQAQIPVTLPTYDEAVGREGVDRAAYNDWLLAQLAPERLNVLTIHAEVEGISCADLFADFLQKAIDEGWTFVPLAALLPEEGSLPPGQLAEGVVQGREGPVACQKEL